MISSRELESENAWPYHCLDAALASNRDCARRVRVAGDQIKKPFVGLWIKLSVILFLQGWRKRLIFCLSLGIIAVIGYLPALVQDAAVVYTNVFGYRGLALQTVGGVPVWGPRVLFSFFGSPTNWLANWQTRIEYPFSN